MRRLVNVLGFLFADIVLCYSYAAYLWIGEHGGIGDILAMGSFQMRVTAQFSFAAIVGAIATSWSELPLSKRLSQTLSYLLALLLCTMFYHRVSQMLPPDVVRSPVMLIVFNIILSAAFAMTALIP